MNQRDESTRVKKFPVRIKGKAPGYVKNQKVFGWGAGNSVGRTGVVELGPKSINCGGKKKKGKRCDLETSFLASRGGKEEK